MRFRKWLMEQEMPDISHYRLGSRLGSGTTVDAHEVEGDPSKIVGLIRRKGDATTLAQVRERQRRLSSLPAGISPQIHMVGSHGGRDAFVMDRAMGSSVHDSNPGDGDWSRRLAELAAVPLEHYRDLVSKSSVLKQHGFGVDASNSNNLLYHPGSGFTHLDLGMQDGPVSGMDLTSPILRLDKHGAEATEADLRNALVIIEKLIKSGYSAGEILQSQKTVVHNLEARDPHLGAMYLGGLERLGLPKNVGREQMTVLKIGEKGYEVTPNSPVQFIKFIAGRVGLPDKEKYADGPFRLSFNASSGKYYLTPSVDGVRVDGVDATGDVELADGSEIQFGDAVPFKVHYSSKMGI